MGLRQTVAPVAEPITLAEAKLHLRVDHSDEDALIEALIAAAREWVEAFTRRQIMTATWLLTLDEFPGYTDDGEILLPFPPIQSVTSVQYLDSAGATQTVSSADYAVDLGSLPGRIVLKSGEVWPAALDEPNAVMVTFVAGYASAAAVPSSIKAAIKLLVAGMYEHRESETTAAVEETPTIQRLLWPWRVLQMV